MKNLIVLFTILLSYLNSTAQYIERFTYYIPIGVDAEFGTTLKQLSDGGFAVGGQGIEYVFNGYITHTREKEFVLRLDSGFNISWYKNFMLWGDDYPFHTVNFILETSDNNICYVVDTDLAYYDTAFHMDSIDGSTKQHVMLPTDSIDNIVSISRGVEKNDTIYLSGKTHFSSTVLFALNKDGDTLFYKVFSSYSTVQPVAEIFKDSQENLFLAFYYQNWPFPEILLLGLDQNANVISTDTIEISRTFKFDNMYIQNRGRIFVNEGNFIKIYNNNHLVDSLYTGSDICTISLQKNNNVLIWSNCGSYSLFLPGNYFISYDSTGQMNYSLRLNNDDYLDYIQSINDSTAFATGNSNDSILLVKLSNPPHISGNLIYNQNFLCMGDSQLVTAPNALYYHWSTGDTTQSIWIKSAGNYFAYIEDSNGIGIITDTARILFHPDFHLGNDTILCNTQSMLLFAPTGYNSYFWNDGNINIIDSVYTTSSTDTIIRTLTITDSTGCSNSDTIQIFFDVCAFDIYQNERSNVRIIPNPAKEKILVDFKGTHFPRYNFQLSDGEGKMVIEKVIFDSEEIDIQKLKSGLYFYLLYSDNSIISKGKIIIY